MSEERPGWEDLRKPIGPATLELKFERWVSKSQIESLTKGLWPQAMEDKWIVMLEEGVLNIYRSWTSDCIFNLPLKRCASGGSLGPLIVTAEPDIYRRTSDKDDIALVNRLIDSACQAVAGPKKEPSIVWGWLALGVFLALILLVYWGISSRAADMREFREHGKVVLGMITKQYKNIAPRSGWTTEYQYEMNGRVFNGSTTKTIPQARVGDAIEIVCLTDKPDRSTYADKDTRPVK